MYLCTWKRSFYLRQKVTKMGISLVSKSLPVKKEIFANYSFPTEKNIDYALPNGSSAVSVFRKYRLFPSGKHSSFGCSAQAGVHFLLRNPVSWNTCLSACGQGI